MTRDVSVCVAQNNQGQITQINHISNLHISNLVLKAYNLHQQLESLSLQKLWSGVSETPQLPCPSLRAATPLRESSPLPLLYVCGPPLPSRSSCCDSPDDGCLNTPGLNRCSFLPSSPPTGTHRGPSPLHRRQRRHLSGS